MVGQNLLNENHCFTQTKILAIGVKILPTLQKDKYCILTGTYSLC